MDVTKQCREAGGRGSCKNLKIQIEFILSMEYLRDPNEPRCNEQNSDVQKNKFIKVSRREIRHRKKTLRACSLKGRRKPYGRLIVVEGRRKSLAKL